MRCHFDSQLISIYVKDLPILEINEDFFDPLARFGVLALLDFFAKGLKIDFFSFGVVAASTDVLDNATEFDETLADDEGANDGDNGVDGFDTFLDSSTTPAELADCFSLIDCESGDASVLIKSFESDVCDAPFAILPSTDIGGLLFSLSGV